MTENKSFGLSLVIWFFTGGIGGHRIYINENVFVLFFYWIGTLCTFGLLPLIDLFLIKGMIRKANLKGGN